MHGGGVVLYKRPHKLSIPNVFENSSKVPDSFGTSVAMVQIKFLFVFLAVMTIVVLAANMADADCLSGKYKGPCAVWDNEMCRRICKEEGHISGHCSPSLKCWCEGC